MHLLKYTMAVLALLSAPAGARSSSGDLPSASDGSGHSVLCPATGAAGSSKICTPSQIVVATPARPQTWAAHTIYSRPGDTSTDGMITPATSNVEVWRQASARSSGSANEQAAFFSLNIPSGHGSGIAYEAEPIYGRCVTADSNTYGLGAYDCVGGEFQGATLGTGQRMRVWGADSRVTVVAGSDGYATGWESDIANNSTTGALQTATVKHNFFGVCLGPNNCTSIFDANAAGGSKYTYGFPMPYNIFPSGAPVFAVVDPGASFASIGGIFADGHSLALNNAFVTGAAGTTRYSGYYTGVNSSALSLRWNAGANQNAESGANAGSDYGICSYSDTGASLACPLTITRATGTVHTNALAVSGQSAAGSFRGPLVGPNCQNIVAFGADNSGVSDSSAAFAAAVAAAPTGGQVCVYLPAGTFRFTSAQAISLASAYPSGSITISGDGPNVTNLNFASGSGGLALTLTSQFQSFHIHNLAVLAGSASTTNAGIAVHQMQASIPNPANSGISDISNVEVRGDDGFVATNAFGYNVLLSSVSNVNLINDNFVGSLAMSNTCVRISGTSSSAIAVVLNLTGVFADWCNIGLDYGNHVQGVTVHQTNFTGGHFGIYSDASLSDLSQLAVSDSQFNMASAGIDLLTDPGSVMIANNYFIVIGTGIPAINIAAAMNDTITANVLQGNGASNGIVIGGYANYASSIVGNNFNGFATAIWLRSGSKNVVVSDNAYLNDTTNVLNSGTANTTGASCSGAPTSSFATSPDGRVIHC